MRFDRKLYMVAMVIFAVSLFTTEVFATTYMLTAAVPDQVPPLVSFNSAVLEDGGETITITPIAGWRVIGITLTEGSKIEDAYTYCSQEHPKDKLDCTITSGAGLNEIVFEYLNSLQANFTLTATLEEIPTFTYTVTNTSAGPFGVIRGPAGDSLYGEPPAPLEHTIYEGSDRTFYFIQSDFCQVTDVLVDGASIGAVSSHTFVDATPEHTIEATFEPIPVFANFSGPSGEITTDDQVTFTDESVGELTYRNWYISTDLNPVPVLISSYPEPLVFDFTEAGTYTVTLEVGNAATSNTYSADYVVISSYTSDPVTVGETQVGYGSIMEAYNAIPATGETIKLKAGEITEDLIIFDDPVTFELKGGYDESFAIDDGFTTIKGNVTISFGQVTISKVIISSL